MIAREATVEEVRAEVLIVLEAIGVIAKPKFLEDSTYP
jgi:hypothetical protein